MKQRAIMAAIAATTLIAWGPNDPTGDIAIPENVGATGVTFLDDISVCWGTGCKYWLVYNSTTDTFKLWSTDIDNGVGTDGELQTWEDGTDDLLVKGTINGFPATTDALPIVLALTGADTWAQATGANRVGGNLRVGPGIGTRQIVCSDRTLTDTDTVTLTIDGSATVLVESTDFDCEGEASEDACCLNLGAAIDTAAIGLTADCATTAGTCYLTPAARLSSVDLAIADGGVNGTGWTLVEGADGEVVLGGVDAVMSNLDGSITIVPQDGTMTIDKTGTNTNSAIFELTGDNAGNEVASSFFTAYGAQPYLVIQVDDDGTTPTPVQVVHLDDNSLRAASAGGIALGSATNYFSDVIGAELSCMDSDASNQLSIDWSENDSSDRALTFAVNSGDRAISLSADLTIEATSTVNQDLTTDATGVQFAALELTTGPMVVSSDTNGYCRGAAGTACTDAEDVFDGTDWQFNCPGCTNGIYINRSIYTGPIEGPADSGQYLARDQQVSPSCADDTQFGHVYKTDGINHLSLYAQCDGAGAGDNRRVGILEADPETTLEIVDTAPYLSLTNSTAEDSEGGRESRIIFQGTQSGSEETHLAWIEASHSGSSDDEKGQLKFYTNDTGDGDSPALRLTITDEGNFVTPTYNVDYVVQAGGAALGPTSPDLGQVNGSCGGPGFNNSNETQIISFEIPSCWAGGASDDLTLKVYWCPSSGDAPALNEEVDWEIKYRILDWETDDTTTGNEVTVNGEWTAGGSETAIKTYETEITIDADNGDQPVVAGEVIAITFSRDAANEGTSYSSNAIVQLWEITVPQTDLRCDHQN